MLGQTIDLNAMVWTIGLCLALQRHRGDPLLSLEAEDSSKGAQWSTSMEEGRHFMVRLAKQISCFKQQMMEKLRTQRVCNALVLSSTLVASSSHIGGVEERPNSSASIEVGTW